MKKILLMTAVVCALALSACGNKAATADDAVVTDSIEVVQDSIATDSAVVVLDSLVETVDSCACK